MLNKTGSSASIERITFDGCDEFPCVVHHGTSATGKVVSYLKQHLHHHHFHHHLHHHDRPHHHHHHPQLYMTATVPTSSLTCTIVGVIVGGIELPFNGCPKNACDNMSEGVIILNHIIFYSLDLPGDCPV